MTPNEKKFCSDTAKLAKALQLTPEYALACFGVLAAGMARNEVARGRADRGGAIEAAIGLFTDNLLGALETMETMKTTTP